MKIVVMDFIASRAAQGSTYVGVVLAIAAACGLTIAESQALVIGEAVAVIACMALVAVNK